MTATTIPFFALDREFAELREPVLDQVEEVLRSGQPLGGPWIDDLERELAAVAGRRHAVAVNSCTDALYFAFAALGIGAGDEVLIPDFSFAATVSSVLRAGAVPVFVDLTEAYEPDLTHAEALLGARTRAFVSVDLYGRIGDADAVERFAAEHGLALVEDAAQAFGAVRDGRPAGSVGEVSCFSFDPTKVISGPGSGGAVLTDNEEIAETARLLRAHGRSQGRFERVGFNAQMSSLVAAVLSLKLRHQARWLRARQTVAAAYTAGLSLCDAHLPELPDDREHVFHKYVIRVRDRGRVRDELGRRGVTTLVHYPSTLSALPFVLTAPHRGGGRHAARLAREVVSLPIHPHLRDVEVEQVIDAVAAAVPLQAAAR